MDRQTTRMRLPLSHAIHLFFLSVFLSLPSSSFGQSCDLSSLLASSSSSSAAANGGEEAAGQLRPGTCSASLMSGSGLPTIKEVPPVFRRLSGFEDEPELELEPMPSAVVVTPGSVSYCNPRCPRGYRLTAPRVHSALEREWDGYACFAGQIHYYHSATTTASKTPISLSKPEAVRLRCEPSNCALHDDPEHHICLGGTGNDACSTSLKSGESCEVSCLPGYKFAPKAKIPLSTHKGCEATPFRASCCMGNVTMPTCVRKSPSEGFCDLQSIGHVPADHLSLRTSVLSCLAPTPGTCPATHMLQHGSECSFECEAGYRIDPPNSRVACQSDGSAVLVDEDGNRLDQQRPQRCVPVGCTLRSVPDSGEHWFNQRSGKIVKDYSVSSGSNVTLVCREGYSLKHDGGVDAVQYSGSVCDKGAFDPPLPEKCFKECLAPTQSAHGRWMCGKDTAGNDIPCPGEGVQRVAAGASASLKCDLGYSTEGKLRTQVCGSNGRFMSDLNIECKPQCRPPPLSQGVRSFSLLVPHARPNASEIECPAIVSSSQSCTLKCKPGFALPRLTYPTSQCSNGEWNPPFPQKCMPLCRLPLSHRVHGTWKCLHDPSYEALAKLNPSTEQCSGDELGAVVRPHETAVLQCDEGYSLLPSERGIAGARTCGSSGQWRGSQPPLAVACHPKCSLPVVPNGAWMCQGRKCANQRDHDHGYYQRTNAKLMPGQSAKLACAFPSYPFPALPKDEDSTSPDSVVCGKNGELEWLLRTSSPQICMGPGWVGCVADCAKQGKCCSTAESVCGNGKRHCCHDCPVSGEGVHAPPMDAFSSPVFSIPTLENCLFEAYPVQMHCYARSAQAKTEADFDFPAKPEL